MHSSIIIWCIQEGITWFPLLQPAHRQDCAFVVFQRTWEIAGLCSMMVDTAQGTPSIPASRCFDCNLGCCQWNMRLGFGLGQRLESHDVSIQQLCQLPKSETQTRLPGKAAADLSSTLSACVSGDNSQDDIVSRLKLLEVRSSHLNLACFLLRPAVCSHSL